VGGPIGAFALYLINGKAFERLCQDQIGEEPPTHSSNEAGRETKPKIDPTGPSASTKATAKEPRLVNTRRDARGFAREGDGSG
jgi:hypothetical protein